MEKFAATIFVMAGLAVLWAWIAWHIFSLISRCNGGKKKKSSKPSLPVVGAEKEEIDEYKFWRGYF